MASEFFDRQRECRFYTAGCGNIMAVSVTGPRAVNELGGPVIPGSRLVDYVTIVYLKTMYLQRTIWDIHLFNSEEYISE